MIGQQGQAVINHRFRCYSWIVYLHAASNAGCLSLHACADHEARKASVVSRTYSRVHDQRRWLQCHLPPRVAAKAIQTLEQMVYELHYHIRCEQLAEAFGAEVQVVENMKALVINH